MLNIDGRCLARLKEELTKALQSVQLTNGTYINFRSLGGIFTIPEILPQSGPVRSSINAIFDESNIAEFLLGQLQIEIDDKIEFTPGQEGSLTDLPEFVELEVLASRLVSDFNSLPWRYCVSVRLPDPLSNLFPLEKTRLDLSPTLRLVRSTSDLNATYPLASDSQRRSRRMRGSLGSLLISPGPAEWPLNALFIQVECEGYIGMYGGSKTAHSAERSIRSFLGMGLATNLLSSGNQSSPGRVTAYVHRLIPDERWEPVTRYDLSEGMAQGISRLSMGGNALSPTDKPLWLARGVQVLADALSATDSARVLSAAQWHFDGYTRLDPLLAFVQAMVVLEIMFGEEEHSAKIGVMEVIASRFAYFVGTSSEERTRLMAKLRDIYRVRSQIVHTGKARLSGDEQSLFYELQLMGGRSIAKELELLHSTAARGRRNSLVEALARSPNWNAGT